MSSQHAEEMKAGTRFAFGENWSRFLIAVDDERIREAERSLCEMLNVTTLQGKRFLDIGSGSGLFSLAARKLRATVHSFDYDPASVACATELRRRHFPNDTSWTVQQGSVLDKEFLESLGQWDIVYSWGVLHHTGNMMAALENVSGLVREEGKLFIAIYNDQGRASGWWLKVKEIYNRLPRQLRWLVLLPVAVGLWGPATVRDFAIGRPFQTWRNYAKGSQRGMEPSSALEDWVGGLPFEVATPERIFSFYRDRGFGLEQLKTCAGGHGCNEFVFCKGRRGVEAAKG